VQGTGPGRRIEKLKKNRTKGEKGKINQGGSSKSYRKPSGKRGAGPQGGNERKGRGMGV